MLAAASIVMAVSLIPNQQPNQLSSQKMAGPENQPKPRLSTQAGLNTPATQAGLGTQAGTATKDEIRRRSLNHLQAFSLTVRSDSHGITYLSWGVQEKNQ
ncbi:hypothetical protein [Effusibacillus dendaii]|uniref:Uncharacterized protein n=1 Tax=Effusibacillus dendaii TaxID=2743772 RepID=A0A7I8D9G8_9BACL|nr:hypothetical protein [Effusibacillus dendaii]BCJ86793.1 hypothetical protein skT53_17780 [Effusibacillus dendaii]